MYSHDCIFVLCLSFRISLQGPSFQLAVVMLAVGWVMGISNNSFSHLLSLIVFQHLYVVFVKRQAHIMCQ